MPKIGFGFMGSYSAAKGLTPFERFYLGGNALTGVARLDGRELISLRGYEEQEVSSNLGDPIITRYSLELRYPISLDRKSTRLNSSHVRISYAIFCLKKKNRC